MALKVTCMGIGSVLLAAFFSGCTIERQDPRLLPAAAFTDPSAQSRPITILTPAEQPTTNTAVSREGAAPKPAPTTAPGVSSGFYMLAGTVAAEANGQPIYANKVLRLVRVALATKARELDASQFRTFASDLIKKQVGELVNAELEFAAAQRNLDQEDKNLAEALTMRWRGQQITQAGGSIEIARRKAIADGSTFEELVKEQHRSFMVQVFYQKKIIPRIQVSAKDMRRYYQKNLQSEFAKHDKARFRLIKINVQQSAGREAALAKAKSLYEQAIKGADFAALASGYNDDSGLKGTGGDVGVIDRGAFLHEKVEKAVWELQPGQITEPIDNGNAFFVAKLEDVQKGSTQSFEDQEVQAKIRNTLWREQYRTLREQERAKLESSAVIRWDPAMIEATVDMAMQEYPRWSAR